MQDTSIEGERDRKEAPTASTRWVAPSDALLEEVDEYFEAGLVVRRGDVVLDVGANVGAFAARVAERTEGTVILHCFEPSRDTFARLEASLAQGALQRAALRAWPLALTRSDTAGVERDFFHFARSPTNSTYDLADKHAEYEAYFAAQAGRMACQLARWIPFLGEALGRAWLACVRALMNRDNGAFVWLAHRATGMRVERCRTDSIERWAGHHGVTRIDVLKVDVEGAELDVLEGCGSLWPCIGSVAVETHDRHGRADAVRELLCARGFTSIRSLRPNTVTSEMVVLERPGCSQAKTCTIRIRIKNGGNVGSVRIDTYRTSRGRVESEQLVRPSWYRLLPLSLAACGTSTDEVCLNISDIASIVPGDPALCRPGLSRAYS